MANSCVNVKLMHNINEIFKHIHFVFLPLITWDEDIFNVDKLRTYVTFRQEYGTEHYVKVVTNRQHRAALSQFKSGNREISRYSCRI